MELNLLPIVRLIKMNLVEPRNSKLRFNEFFSKALK